ncbi:MAG: hypothetical protein BAA01_06105 [Bacillus thermozeamaize]|uniref:Uncharacterized protein n=1 Tax=Bacillus thermozeamaize TaxID=230954 RepID=A0A1Y3PBI5_9BACI|nr:MAG: hypothetical protein BAA01_06105 [Bacillus thermozeamaize]
MNRLKQMVHVPLPLLDSGHSLFAHYRIDEIRHDERTGVKGLIISEENHLADRSNRFILVGILICLIWIALKPVPQFSLPSRYPWNPQANPWFSLGKIESLSSKPI